MIKLIVSDIDETLVKSDKSIPERNISAIKKAQKQGVKVMLASGRGPFQLRNYLQELDLIDDDTFSILCNGGVVINNLTKEVVDKDPLDFKKAEKIFEYAYDKNLEFQVYTDKACYCLMEDKIIPDKKYESTVYLTEKNIDFLKNEIIVKVIIRNEDLNFLLSLEEDVARLTNWDVSISYSSDVFMEINKKGINKANALEKVVSRYGLDMSEVMVIGDNFNDKEMLEIGGKSIAVQNAHLLLKEIADYITIATNNDGAVGEAIEKFALNKKTK